MQSDFNQIYLLTLRGAEPIMQKESPLISMQFGGIIDVFE